MKSIISAPGLIASLYPVATNKLVTLAQSRTDCIAVIDLIGYNSTEEEDLYRCQMIHDFGHDPYIMPFVKSDRSLYSFKRFIDSRTYRGLLSIEDAWNTYRYKE